MKIEYKGGIKATVNTAAVLLWPYEEFAVLPVSLTVQIIKLVVLVCFSSIQLFTTLFF